MEQLYGKGIAQGKPTMTTCTQASGARTYHNIPGQETPFHANSQFYLSTRQRRTALSIGTIRAQFP